MKKSVSPPNVKNMANVHGAMSEAGYGRTREGR
jgi:hypothetical protein